MISEKLGIVFVSLFVATISFILLATDGYNVVPPRPTTYDFLLAATIFFSYPVVGAILYPITSSLKKLALKEKNIEVSNSEKITHIAFWPISVLLSLIIYPSLILINFLTD